MRALAPAEHIMEPRYANSIPGFVRDAETDVGNKVKVWCPVPGVAADQQYFCHGHSLGTFALFGYNVTSGRALRQVLKDEWILIGNPCHAQAGDIVVWYNAHPQADPFLIDHSALILNVEKGSHGIADPTRITVSSKSGSAPLKPRIPLSDLIRVYSDKYVLFRRRG